MDLFPLVGRGVEASEVAVSAGMFWLNISLLKNPQSQSFNRDIRVLRLLDNFLAGLLPGLGDDALQLDGFAYADVGQLFFADGRQEFLGDRNQLIDLGAAAINAVADGLDVGAEGLESPVDPELAGANAQ